MISRGVIAAIGIAVLATVVVWLWVMPDEPQRALEDGAGAAALATLIVGAAIRRGLS
ncbi:hypothetical protein M446_2420 [Methylobacterium sp. 4-46]|uniref:hypothetical protein n=1 Tax=unclassified Methylobacterium TaxID=2615210 RepID=UPI000165C7E5|nr:MULTISPECIES: hypothetical protein [Methylobacterium]ACA16876.1 hypothetical protein M446_2420 [Methylobacterium sp. 4-46]WFT82567.1 hypothetical protein QA634_12255 [Methylobacterium nodulans]